MHASNLLKAQVIYYQNGGKLNAVTGSLHNWKPDSTNPALQIKTRDHRGLLHKQDLPPVQISRYKKKPSQEDARWQKNLRKAQIPAKIGKSNVVVFETKKAEELPTALVQQNVLPGMDYSQINPADPSVAVGPSHIIQMVNGNNGSALFKIMDKEGRTLLGPAYLDQLPGTSHNGGGDGVTWYDQFSNRFIMTEFGDSAATGTNMNTLIMAVSASSDPLGSWFVYEFFANGYFPDYPKYGNYPDAWFAVTRDFKDQYEGSGIWAFDKKAMLVGNPEISLFKVRLTDKDNKYNSMAPVTFGGSTLQMESDRGYFLYHSDNELTASENDKDSIVLISFKASFADSTLSSLKFEKGFEVAPFSSQVCLNRNCAPSPDGQGYDVVSNKIMHKPYLRDFGSHQSIVLNHTVDVNGNGLSGIRWYELRKDTVWRINQQGTYAPQSTAICSPGQYKHRFLGNIIQNGYGQIALAYNYSSNADYASIAYTGRQAGDSLNTFTHEETIIKRGTGYGTDAFRWGDYNDISPDPENDSLFWFTGMTGAGSSTWTTSITSFTVGPKPALDAKLSAVISPSPCDLICNNKIKPVVLLRNNGMAVLRNLSIHFSVNDAMPTSVLWTGTLFTDEEVTYQLPEFTFPAGNSKLKIWIEQPSGLTDLNRSNDTITQSIDIDLARNLPFFEGGESTASIPSGWKSLTNGSSNLNWRSTRNAAYEGTHSFLFDNFNNNEPGKYSQLSSPLITANNVDSLTLKFQLANAMYDNQKIDTLEVQIATNCGNTLTTVYKKWGANLSTKNDFVTQDFIPLMNDWRTETISLKAFLNQEFSIVFKATNQFGNNIYIDAIDVQSFNFPMLDLKTEKILLPADALCADSIKPKLIFTSLGKEDVKHVQLELREGAELKESRIWTGTLTRLHSDTIAFSAIATKPKMQLSIVIQTVNEQKDENTKNDTLAFQYQSAQQVQIPFSENFEPSQALQRWSVNGDSTNGWEKAASGFRSGESITAKNFRNVKGTGSIISPRLNWLSADSVWLEFQVAAGYNPGLPADTLEVSVSFDCGINWKAVYRQSSREMAMNETSKSFLPTVETDWKLVRIDLSDLSYKQNEMLIRFTNKNLGNNNIFVDQVKVYPLDVSSTLKEKGFRLLPNPVKEKLYIQFYPNSGGLESIHVSDIAGKTQYFIKMDGSLYINNYAIDFSKLAAGIYVVTLNYTDRIVSEKIIKHNP